MRKLTVKNFSVIKEAELEFGKITVLIGPQSSGKSLLCKLAYFFEQVVPERVQHAFMLNIPYGELCTEIQAEFLDKFPETSWTGQDLQISHESPEFTISRPISSSQLSPTFGFDPRFAGNYPRWIEQDKWIREQAGPGVNVGRVLQPPSIKKMQVDEGRVDIEVPMIQNSVYIPTGRSFYSITNRAFAALTTKNLDWITQRYAPEFDSEYKVLRKSYGTESPMLSEFGKAATNILKGRVVHEGGRLVFESTEDGRRRPFELLSSGTLELLPVINTLSRLAEESNSHGFIELPEPPFGTIYIEEPELSVFPSTQYNLVRLIAWLAGLNGLHMKFAITTHSPYILTAFNNLIEAGQVARRKPELKDEVAKLIPEQYWINEGDFKAYAIEDGVLQSIVAKDTGLVSANYLDQVSETICVEFDELLRLGYVES
jgi:hypothetical protein